MLRSCLGAAVKPHPGLVELQRHVVLSSIACLQRSNRYGIVESLRLGPILLVKRAARTVPGELHSATTSTPRDPAAPKTVAIVGGGAAGILSARYAKQEGLKPTIFDRCTTVGGLWGPIATYKSLRTNFTKYNMKISDFPWPESAPLYPTKAQFGQYLSDYFATHFPNDGAGMVKLGTEVTSVAPAGSSLSGKWEVAWREQGNILCKQIFDHVIIASGFFSAPRIPPLTGLDTFPGPTLHSSQYSAPNYNFTNRHVLVVGGSISGAEIAAEAASAAAASVTHVMSPPFWALPRYLPLDRTNPATPYIPLELALFFKVRPRPPGEMQLVNEATSRQQHAMLSQICGDQGVTISPEMSIPADGSPQYVSISNTYGALARAGRIKVVKGLLGGLQGGRPVLRDGTVIPQEVDAIVFATGYHQRLGILPQELLDKMEYDPKDGFLPVLLHKSTWHPALPGLGFVGIHPRPFVPMMEVQARWVAGVLAGRLPVPSEEQQRAGVKYERQIREQKVRGQFAYPDTLGRQYAIAAEAGVMLPEEWIQKQQFVQAEHFAGDLEQAEAAVRKLDEELEVFRQGWRVPFTVFRGLQGKWKVERVIESRRAEQPSGRVEGTAEFRMVGADVNEYLYTEQGVFRLEGGAEMKVSRQYVYRYEEGADRVDVYFAGEGGAKTYLFHSVKVLSPGEEWPPLHGGVREEAGWRGVGTEHLCVEDMYRTSYWWAMAGLQVREFQVRYTSEGPRKDYTSTASYSRG